MNVQGHENIYGDPIIKSLISWLNFVCDQRWLPTVFLGISSYFKDTAMNQFASDTPGSLSWFLLAHIALTSQP